MASDRPTVLAVGTDVHGTRWSVSTGLGALFIDVGDLTAIIYCEGEPERFAEAVARAVTPGQAASDD